MSLTILYALCRYSSPPITHTRYQCLHHNVSSPPIIGGPSVKFYPDLFQADFTEGIERRGHMSNTSIPYLNKSCNRHEPYHRRVACQSDVSSFPRPLPATQQQCVDAAESPAVVSSESGLKPIVAGEVDRAPVETAKRLSGRHFSLPSNRRRLSQQPKSNVPSTESRTIPSATTTVLPRGERSWLDSVRSWSLDSSTHHQAIYGSSLYVSVS